MRDWTESTGSIKGRNYNPNQSAPGTRHQVQHSQLDSHWLYQPSQQNAFSYVSQIAQWPPNLVGHSSADNLPSGPRLPQHYTLTLDLALPERGSSANTPHGPFPPALSGLCARCSFLPNSPPSFHLRPVNTSTSQFRIHFLWDTFLDKPLPQDWLEPLLSASSTLVLIYTCSFSIMFLFIPPGLESRRLSIHVLNK